MPSNSRPTIWYSHDLPFMNKTSWAKLYSASQHKVSKPSPTNRSASGPLTPGPRVRVTSYASALRSVNTAAFPQYTTDSPTPTGWNASASNDSHRSPIDLPVKDPANACTLTIAGTPDLFRSLLAENTTDPQALVVQKCLNKFISRTVQRSHGDKLETVCARVDDLTISSTSRMQATEDLIQESNARITSLMTI